MLAKLFNKYKINIHSTCLLLFSAQIHFEGHKLKREHGLYLKINILRILITLIFQIIYDKCVL